MQDKNIKNAPESDIATVPYIAYEAERARTERAYKRCIVALLIAIAVIFASNIIWLYAWCQYDYEVSDTSTITLDSGEGGNANYIGNDGDIHNGESDGNKNTESNADAQKQ